MTIYSILLDKITNLERNFYQPTKIILGVEDNQDLFIELYSNYDLSFRSDFSGKVPGIFGLPITVSKKRRYIGVLSDKPKKKPMRVPREMEYFNVVIPDGYYAKFI